MAELVQRHMESMAEEVEEMRKTKLYTLEETRLILKTRKEFEYRINGVSKTLQDFNEYIAYEMFLLKQIYLRRDKNVIADRKTGIEYKILRRIKNLYEIALQRFSGDFSLSLSYFKFCKQSNFTNAASVAVQNMIKNCYQNPEVWQVAAAWYAHDRNDLNTALKVLNKGLTIHKDSKLLYTEAIKLELSAINKNSMKDETAKDEVCKQIKTYVKFICDRVKDSGYLIEILDLLETSKETTEVQNIIIDRLLQDYSELEFVWHTLAQREKRGLHYGMSDEELKKSGESRLTLCIAKYQEGLKKVSPNEKEKLWSMYLDCLVAAQHENAELPKTVKVNLLNALEQASNEKYLTEKYYITWLELVTDDEALEILEKGTKALPHSIDLWKLRLRYATMTEKNVKVNEVFEEGVEMLKERSLPLWFMYLRYYGLLSRDNIIDDIYRKAIHQPQEISDVLKPQYIEWLAMTKGLDEARKMYNELAHKRPYCKGLHITMSKLESTEIEYNFETWAHVHELACNQFGEEDVDVWINHILFYLHFKKPNNVIEKVNRLHEDAKNTLSPLLHFDFEEKYNKALSEI